MQNQNIAMQTGNGNKYQYMNHGRCEQETMSSTSIKAELLLFFFAL